MHIYCSSTRSNCLPSSCINRARQTKLKQTSPVSLKSASSARKLLLHVKPPMKVSEQDYSRPLAPYPVVRSQGHRSRCQAKEVNLITFRVLKGLEFVRGLDYAQICIENAGNCSSQPYEQDRIPLYLKVFGQARSS